MPFFKFKVIDRSNRKSIIKIEGDNSEDAIKNLRGKGYFPLKLYGKTQDDNGKKYKLRVIEFTERLVPLLKAHVQLERALQIILDNEEDIKQKSTIQEMCRRLHEGKSFSKIVRDMGQTFPNIYANLINAGEESGTIIEVSVELLNYLRYKKEIKDFFITNSIYPAIILFVTFTVIILLFTVFLPRFAKIFFDMGKELPLPTKIMFNISTFITSFWWLWLILTAALAFLFSLIRKGGKLKHLTDKVFLKLPLIGKVLSSVEIGRFQKTMAILLINNVHLVRTLQISLQTIQNTVISESLKDVIKEVKGGIKLSNSLSKSKYINKETIQMLEVGEETGMVGEMLSQIAKQQEDAFKSRIKKLLAFFEPAVILFLAFIILAVVISIFFAILEMNEI